MPKPPRDKNRQASAGRRRDALRAVLVRRDLTPSELARLADVKANSLYNFLNERSHSLSSETLERLAAVLPGESMASLQGIGAPPNDAESHLIIRAVACAGRWNETFELPKNKQSKLAFPITQSDIACGAFGVRVEHPGAEHLFPNGSILVCMPISRWQGDLPDGVKLLIQAIRDGKSEVTVRELESAPDAKKWLVQRSDRPQFNSAIPLPYPNYGQPWRVAGDRMSLVGVIISYFVYEPFAKRAEPVQKKGKKNPLKR
jgi:transcriptional regulator with XRE-family HTH domain